MAPSFSNGFSSILQPVDFPRDKISNSPFWCLFRPTSYVKTWPLPSSWSWIIGLKSGSSAFAVAKRWAHFLLHFLALGGSPWFCPQPSGNRRRRAPSFDRACGPEEVCARGQCICWIVGYGKFWSSDYVIGLDVCLPALPSSCWHPQRLTFKFAALFAWSPRIQDF